METNSDNLSHPVQPIYSKNGVYRFKENKIINHLFESGKLSLNDVVLLEFADEDWVQLAQLLGYSVSGFGDLSYVSDEDYGKAEILIEKNNKIDPRDLEIKALKQANEELRKKLKKISSFIEDITN